MFNYKFNKIWVIQSVLAIAFCFSLYNALNHQKTAEAKNNPVDILKTKTSSDNEVVVSNREGTTSGNSIPTFGEGKSADKKVTSDGSEITAMYDAYGNKVEIRNFSDHPTLTSLTLKSFADGSKEATAFGRNGEKKNIPLEMIGRVLTTSGDEIARTVGIFQIKTEQPTIVSVQPSVPTQSNESPIAQQKDSLPQAKDNIVEIQVDLKANESSAKEKVNQQNISFEREKTAQINKVKDTNN